VFLAASMQPGVQDIGMQNGWHSEKKLDGYARVPNTVPVSSSSPKELDWSPPFKAGFFFGSQRQRGLVFDFAQRDTGIDLRNPRQLHEYVVKKIVVVVH